MRSISHVKPDQGLISGLLVKPLLSYVISAEATPISFAYHIFLKILVVGYGVP